MDLGLRDRVAIVAASSQGIGRATADAFAAEGCRVAMCARSEQRLQAAAGEIRQQHAAEVFCAALDVTDANSVRDFVAAVVAKFGSADICVTNAGGPPAKGFLATSHEDWQKAVDANFLSTVHFAREVIPHMQRKHWGRIISITSITTKQPVKGFLATSHEDWQKAVDANFLSTVHFAREVIPHMQRKHWGRIISITSITTKQPVTDLVLSNAVRAAVVGLVKSLANEFGKDGILVNNVGPGFTATDRLKELAKVQAAKSGQPERAIFDAWAQDAPLKRLGDPREIAETIVWLASERASYITGQTILVDGGMYKGL